MTFTGKNAVLGRTAWRLGAVLLLALVPWQAWAGDAPPAASASTLTDDPFAVLHTRLEGKADEVLLRVAASADSPSASGAGGQGEAAAEPAIAPAAYERFAQRYWKGQERPLRRVVERISGLRPLVDPILKEQGVPAEILGLMLVESGGNPWALSPKGARGLWQLMPATARRYDLRVTDGTDDRLDVQKSTLAAARHLRDLQERFGSWPLALAAYNAGADTVKQAVSRAGTTDFATLSSLRLLPAETRAYVPAVLAAAPLFGSTGLQQGEQRRNLHGTILYAAPAGTSAGKKREREIRKAEAGE